MGGGGGGDKKVDYSTQCRAIKIKEEWEKREKCLYVCMRGREKGENANRGGRKKKIKVWIER